MFLFLSAATCKSSQRLARTLECNKLERPSFLVTLSCVLNPTTWCMRHIKWNGPVFSVAMQVSIPNVEVSKRRTGKTTILLQNHNILWEILDKTFVKLKQKQKLHNMLKISISVAYNSSLFHSWACFMRLWTLASGR